MLVVRWPRARGRNPARARRACSHSSARMEAKVQTQTLNILRTLQTCQHRVASLPRQTAMAKEQGACGCSSARHRQPNVDWTKRKMQFLDRRSECAANLLACRTTSWVRTCLLLALWSSSAPRTCMDGMSRKHERSCPFVYCIEEICRVSERPKVLWNASTVSLNGLACRVAHSKTCREGH